MVNIKTTKRLEKIVRGFSNHRRIEIMYLLEHNPELSIFEISDKLHVNFKTISEHTRRLNITGLVMKRSENSSVRHKLTPLGIFVLKFLRTLE